MAKRVQSVKYYLAASIAFITFIVYVPTLQNDFINWDNDLYVSDNIHIRSIDPTFFKWAFFDFYAAYWQPHFPPMLLPLKSFALCRIPGGQRLWPPGKKCGGADAIRRSSKQV